MKGRNNGARTRRVITIVCIVAAFAAALIAAGCELFTIRDTDGVVRMGVSNAGARYAAANTGSKWTSGSTEVEQQQNDKKSIAGKKVLETLKTTRTPMFIIACYGNRYYVAGNGRDDTNYGSGKYKKDSETDAKIYAKLKAGTINEDQYNHLFEGGLSPMAAWKMVPESLKPYTVIELHENNMSEGDPQPAKWWYDDQMDWCDENGVPAIIMVAGARGNSDTGTDSYGFNHIRPKHSGNTLSGDVQHDGDKEWLDEMVEKHPSFAGVMMSENYGHGSQALEGSYYQEWIDYAKTKDLVIMAFDSHNLDNTIRQLESSGNDGQNFVQGFKGSNEYDSANVESLVTGMWLKGKSLASALLIDTWYNRDKGPAGIGPKGANESPYGALGYPEGAMAAWMLQMYINGTTVFNFEAPWAVYGNYGKPSEYMLNVIAPVFEWMAEHPAPTREEMVAYYGYKAYGAQDWAPNDGGSGFPIAEKTKALFDRGKYGLRPRVMTGTESISADKWTVDGTTSASTNSNGDQTSNWGDKVFDGKSGGTQGGSGGWGSYPKNQRAAVFGWPQKKNETDTTKKAVGDNKNTTWVFINSTCSNDGVNNDAAVTTNNKQKAKVTLDGGAGAKWLEVEMGPYTSVAINRKDDKTMEVFLHNYLIERTGWWSQDKLGKWMHNETVTTDIQAGLCSGINTEYTTKYKRDVVFTFGGCTSVNTTTKSNANCTAPTSASAGSSGSNCELKVSGNGWVRFDVTFS